MKDFPGYEKIAESLDRWKLDPAAFRRLSKSEWVVTEKIHGANFCIATDGVEVRCANRRAWIAPDESFFGYETVREDLAPKLRELFRQVKADLPDVVSLYLYGELFGGGYPHPEVKPIDGVQPIQTGVWYAPDIRFCAFDLRIENAGGERRYLDYADVVKRCAEVDIPAAVPLFVGKYEAAAARDIRFDSTIPRLLGLPGLPIGTNLAEGVVIKPYREVAMTAPNGERLRPVIKRKITEFGEDKRYHEATKWQAPAVPLAPEAPKAPPLETLQWEALCRMVDNRRNAAASKIGYVSGKTPEKEPLLFRLLMDEVLDEVQTAFPDASQSLTEAEQVELNQFIAAEVQELIKSESP
jgi:Rnl2 family RNA ligase